VHKGEPRKAGKREEGKRRSHSVRQSWSSRCPVAFARRTHPAPTSQHPAPSTQHPAPLPPHPASVLSSGHLLLPPTRPTGISRSTPPPPPSQTLTRFAQSFLPPPRPRRPDCCAGQNQSTARKLTVSFRPSISSKWISLCNRSACGFLESLRCSLPPSSTLFLSIRHTPQKYRSILDLPPPPQHTEPGSNSSPPLPQPFTPPSSHSSPSPSFYLKKSGPSPPSRQLSLGFLSKPA
jgi:hypothetical protein